MVLAQLTDVVWEFFQQGRAKATSQTYGKQDISQMCRLTAGNLFRARYYESKKLDEFGEADYSYMSPLLSIKEFVLTDADARGMRRADMSGFDLYRLPNNCHFTNLYTVGEGCQGDDGSQGTIVQVKPGEERFYLGPKFKFFKFYVVKGRGVDTYNFPSCIKAIEIETTYDDPNIDIAFDVAYEVAIQVLGLTLKVPGFDGKDVDNSFSSPHLLVKRSLQQQEAI